jgi:phage N-6-adenine-methyltransferase
MDFEQRSIAEITVPSKRLRALNLKKVKEIAQSIEELGLINPIAVCESENGLTLMAGLHRLEATKSLGHEWIACSVHQVDATEAELIEIDENLRRQELTVLEQSEHIQRREEILESMGLRAKGGFNGNRYTQEEKGLPFLDIEEVGSATVAPPKTTQDIADEIGLSKRSIQERKQIAKNIEPEVKETLRDTEIANSTTQLVEVARMEPEKQKEFAVAIKTGEVSNVKEFKAKTEPIKPDVNNFTARDGHLVPKLALEETDDQSAASPSLVEEKKEANRFTSMEKSAKTDEHYTPEKITNFLYQFCSEFDLDPCSNPTKNIKAKRHYTKEDNGLEQTWEGSVFINPPFSDVETWVNKALDEYVQGHCKEVVFLSKFDGRVGWFKPLISNFSPFCIVQGYVSYYGNDGDSATFTTALWYLGDRQKEFAQVFDGLGWVCALVDPEF